MGLPRGAAFDVGVWGPALERVGAVAHLSVALYDADAQVVYGPLPATPLCTIIGDHGADAGGFAECARACLAQSPEARPPIIVTRSCLAVVGVSLLRDGAIIGAVIAGYALHTFGDSVVIAQFARESGLPFQTLWAVTRQEQPISTERLLVHGALLQAMGDTLLREHVLRRQAEEAALELAHLASHDALTGLPNRRLLADYVTRALARAHRHQGRLAVLCLDLDRFKQINDRFGHPVGDELLRSVGHNLATCVRRSDIVGRQGGDEFVVVLSELAHAADAGATAQKILTCLDHPHHLAGQDLLITASIGISLYPNDGEDAETLLMHADLALYHAKEKGRHGYQFFAPALNTQAAERQSVEAALRGALEQHEFVLFYQPKIDLTTGTLVGAEALIRWRHPERGLVQPGEFVAIAEECGLIRPIGRWVVSEACRQAQAWQAAGLAPIPVSVNISAVEFRTKSFLTHLVEVLGETGLSPCYLEIELTESVLMTHVETTTTMLHALKTLGVRLALDDFGMGWSSLSYLRHLPVDVLKIDQSFVQEITEHASAGPIVSAMISLGKSLNLRVIAEGVETADQLAFLQAEHCAEGQGYYFSRPLPAPQFAAFLKTHPATS